MKRAKVSVNQIQTREDMEALIGEIASLMLDREAMQNELDARILEIRQDYEARLVENDLLLKEKLPPAKDWAERNRDTFGDRKSIEMVHGTVGFRTGTPKLKTCSGWTWDSVLAQLEALGKTAHVRVKKEVDKESLIAQREALGEQALRGFGLKVVQDETFFIEPKRETTTRDVEA